MVELLRRVGRKRRELLVLVLIAPFELRRGDPEVERQDAVRILEGLQPERRDLRIVLGRADPHRRDLQAQRQDGVDALGIGRAEGLRHDVLRDDAVFPDELDKAEPVASVLHGVAHQPFDAPVGRRELARPDDGFEEDIGFLELVIEEEIVL